MRCDVGFSCRTSDAENQPRQRSTRGLDRSAVGERHQHEPGIGNHCLRGPRENAHHKTAAPANAAEIEQALAQRERYQQKPRPEKAVEGKISWRKPDSDAVLGGDEPCGPADGRADAAQHANQDTGRLRRLAFRVHGFTFAPCR